jgi:hypothetical protein
MVTGYEEKESPELGKIRLGILLLGMKRFVKRFFELLTQNFSARREMGRKNGSKTRLWTVRSRFRRRNGCGKYKSPRIPRYPGTYSAQGPASSAQDQQLL